MTDKPHAHPPQLPHHFPINLPRNRHARKSSIHHLDAIERAAAAFGAELGAVFRFRGDEVGDGGEGVVGFLGGGAVRGEGGD